MENENENNTQEQNVEQPVEEEKPVEEEPPKEEPPKEEPPKEEPPKEEKKDGMDLPESTTEEKKEMFKDLKDPEPNTQDNQRKKTGVCCIVF